MFLLICHPWVLCIRGAHMTVCTVFTGCTLDGTFSVYGDKKILTSLCISRGRGGGEVSLSWYNGQTSHCDLLQKANTFPDKSLLKSKPMRSDYLSKAWSLNIPVVFNLLQATISHAFTPIRVPNGLRDTLQLPYVALQTYIYFNVQLFSLKQNGYILPQSQVYKTHQGHQN